jgi:3-isopropylmalate/(R)-2-methylmalate dehydratase small subunit
MSAPLDRIAGCAAALVRPNINTDVIAPPARGNKADAFGKPDDGAARVFGPWRYDEQGRELPDFVLNRPPFRAARFLIGGSNFACGSSRETAPLWLYAFGIRCIIAPSFGGIFFDNCFRNGLLPMVLPMALIEQLAAQAESGAAFSLDLAERRIDTPDGTSLPIQLPAFRHHQLLTGEDELTITLQRTDEIDRYQDLSRREAPWLWQSAHSQSGNQQ